MRSTAVCATLFALTLGAPNATIRAQSRAPTFVGERVRISTQSPARRVRHVGRVVGVTEDSVKLQADDRATVRSIATTDIVALDASRGQRTNGRRGMLIGALVGAGAGAITYDATYREPKCAPDNFFCWQLEPDRGLGVFAAALVGGVVGLAAGGLVGRAIKTERWVSRPLGAGARLGLVPRGNDVALLVSMRF
jgi:hypothetical protein